jgi:rubrerythrin
VSTRDRYRRKLVRQLQGACSGELAAGHAYRGHWKSLRDETQREHIRIIEAEEWHHRALVKELLLSLEARPSALREAIFWLIGKLIAISCFVGGWFAPMYGAGRLERSNIVEYEEAAVYAALCGRADMVDCLLTMAEVEWEHERYFRTLAATHWMCRILPLWQEPAPKASIRARYAAVAGPTDALAVGS